MLCLNKPILCWPCIRGQTLAREEKREKWEREIQDKNLDMNWPELDSSRHMDSLKRENFTHTHKKKEESRRTRLRDRIFSDWQANITNNKKNGKKIWTEKKKKQNNIGTMITNARADNGTWFCHTSFDWIFQQNNNDQFQQIT